MAVAEKPSDRCHGVPGGSALGDALGLAEGLGEAVAVGDAVTVGRSVALGSEPPSQLTAVSSTIARTTDPIRSPGVLWRSSHGARHAFIADPTLAPSVSEVQSRASPLGSDSRDRARPGL